MACEKICSKILILYKTVIKCLWNRDYMKNPELNVPEESCSITGSPSMGAFLSAVEVRPFLDQSRHNRMENADKKTGGGRSVDFTMDRTRWGASSIHHKYQLSGARINWQNIVSNIVKWMWTPPLWCITPLHPFLVILIFVAVADWLVTCMVPSHYLYNC